MIVIKNVFGGSQVFIKNVFANAENIVVVYNGGEPIEITGGGGGSGDVVGPASATDNAVVRFNGTTGKLIQNSDVTIDDLGNITATNLSGTNTGDQDLSGKANTVHTHAISDTTGLQTALDGKAASSHTHAQSDITNLVTDLAGKAASSHTHAQSDITNLTTDLAGKQATLVSGTNIKTINSTSLLGSGDIAISGGGDALISAVNGLGASIICSTWDLQYCTTTVFTLANSSQTFWGVYLPTDQTITGAKWVIMTNGSYTANNYNGVGLYSYSGGTLTLVASSTNDGNIWQNGTGAQSKAFTTPYSATAGMYFISFLYNRSAQTTAPTLLSKANMATFASLFTNSAKMAATLAAQTALVTPTVAASGITDSTLYPWVALY